MNTLADADKFFQATTLTSSRLTTIAGTATIGV